MALAYLRMIPPLGRSLGVPLLLYVSRLPFVTYLHKAVWLTGPTPTIRAEGYLSIGS